MKQKVALSSAITALDKVLQKGFALHTALVKQEGKYYLHFKVSTWDNRCKACMPDNKHNQKENKDVA